MLDGSLVQIIQRHLMRILDLNRREKTEKRELMLQSSLSEVINHKKLLQHCLICNKTVNCLGSVICPRAQGKSVF